MGAIIKTKQDNEALLSLVTKGMNLVFDNPTHPFLQIKVYDLLYGQGILLKCDHDDFEGQAVCGAFETELDQQVERFNDSHLSFTLFKGVRILILKKKKKFFSHNCTKKFITNFLDEWN